MLGNVFVGSLFSLLRTHPSRSISIDILKGQPSIWQGMGRGRGYYRSYAVALTDAEKKQAREALHKRFKVLAINLALCQSHL
jgi:hypothetical protein